MFLLAAPVVKNSHIFDRIYFRVILKYATTHNHLQPPTTIHKYPQPPTTMHKYPKSSTAFHNYPQPPTTTQKTTQSYTQLSPTTQKLRKKVKTCYKQLCYCTLDVNLMLRAINEAYIRKMKWKLFFFVALNTFIFYFFILVFPGMPSGYKRSNLQHPFC